MASEPKDYTIFIWMTLTANTEATENKVEFLNYAYTVKGFQYHSNNSLQLFELKENNNNKTLNSSCKAQYTRLTFAVSLVDNALSSKYCCVRLITMPKSALTYHRH